jgi:hypothetical protein
MSPGAVEYKTFALKALSEYEVLTALPEAIAQTTDAEIAKLRANGWHLRSVWSCGPRVLATMWREKAESARGQ